MPGFIKVAGEQRPVAVPYVKVSGDWKPVAIGWIKVAGEWKIWHTAEIVDDFNRANSPTLGLASDGFTTWTELSGDWEIRDNTAYHGSGGEGLAAVQLFKATTDVTVEVDIPSGTGLGAAFWVQDASNYWAAIPGRRTRNNPSYYYCADPTYTLNGTQCIKTETTAINGYPVPATYTAPASEFTESYLCCDQGGGTLSGSQCCSPESIPATETTTTTYTCPSGYSGPSATNRCSTPRYKTYSTRTTENFGCLTNFQCQAAGANNCSSSAACSNYSPGTCRCTKTETVCSGCGPDFVLSCANCGGNYFVFATARSSTSYSCPAGYTRSGSTCTRSVCRDADTCTRITYGCPAVSGYSVSRSGSTCTYTGLPPACPSSYTRNSNELGSGAECSRTLYQSAIFVPSSTSYPAVIRVYKVVNGSGSVEYQVDTGQDPRSMQLTTTGSTVAVKLYSGSQLGGTRYQSRSFTAANAAKSAAVGIIKRGQQTSQGTAIDNFRAE